MRLHTLLATLAVAGFVTACGGDGGDGGTTTPTSSSVVLSGVAAKGALQFALVSVHPIKADGSVDLSKTLSSAESDAHVASYRAQLDAERVGAGLPGGAGPDDGQLVTRSAG